MIKQTLEGEKKRAGPNPRTGTEQGEHDDFLFLIPREREKMNVRTEGFNKRRFHFTDRLLGSIKKEEIGEKAQ